MFTFIMFGFEFHMLRYPPRRPMRVSQLISDSSAIVVINSIKAIADAESSKLFMGIHCPTDGPHVGSSISVSAAPRVAKPTPIKDQSN
ncbi:hypothetical protein ACLKA6_011092 [Drosophila palustris]